MVIFSLYSSPVEICEQAQHAIRAAKNRKSWGSFMARAYCLKRGVPLGLYRLACQLEVATQAGF